MKRPESPKRQLLGKWIQKADGDMAAAEALADEAPIHSNAVAFHCQQAAEKYLKAFLVWHEIDFPKTHDLDQILNLVETVDAALAEGLRDAIVLTPYGVELRYPGDRPDATPARARRAIELATKVRDAVMRALPLT